MPTQTKPAAPPDGPSRFGRARRRLRNGLLLALLLAAAVAALYLLLATRWSYSTGERAGYVPGAMPEVFSFTVRDESVAARINASLGSRVVLSYEQHLGLPSCFGETSYWVTGARVVPGP